jgi:hypothetical protein
MFEAYRYHKVIADRTRNIFRRVLLVFMVIGKVAVLFFVITAPSSLRADDTKRPNLHLFEFTSEFYMPMGMGCFDGLMASDGPRHRIAIYWVQPPVFRDHTYFLSYSDFIFTRGQVHYWIYGMSRAGTFNLSGSNDPLLPRDVSPESVARSALAIVNRIRFEPQNRNGELGVGKFFRQSRDRADYSHEAPSEQAGSDQLSDSNVSDVHILNALPYGRKYSKETRSDGALVWRAQRVLDGPHIASVTVKAVSGMEIDHPESTFDPETLGQWAQIPKPYKVYWSFDQVHSKLKDEPDSTVRSCELHDKIEAFLDKNEVPRGVGLALNQLGFKTALMTGDTRRVSRSGQAVVSALCADKAVSYYDALLELARVGAQIREPYPQQADDLVRPLIQQMVKHIGRDTAGAIEKFLPTIESNKWFWHGKLLVEEARSQGLVEKGMADTFTARLETARLARDLPPSDPCEPSASVKKYLAQVDADPLKGTLSLDDVREILQEGLAKPCADAGLELKPEFIEDVVRSIRMIAGEGPFCGDRAKLTKSIERFSGLYLLREKTGEPIDAVLATFLALSFCDSSTPEDHEVLFSQVQKLCAELQSQVNTMLSERGLGTTVPPADVEGVFGLYERIFRQYIDDPLWPAFKFPLTPNEQTRLISRLKQRLAQLEPLFEEMALKVEYGGASPQLKQKTVYEISRAVQQLLPQAAFLRNPPYPGVSCRYEGGYGFTAVIRGPLYREGDRPKEKFKAMKYFHLGHRLEQIVIRERDLARGTNRESESED